MFGIFIYFACGRTVVAGRRALCDGKGSMSALGNVVASTTNQPNQNRTERPSATPGPGASRISHMRTHSCTQHDDDDDYDDNQQLRVLLCYRLQHYIIM